MKKLILVYIVLIIAVLLFGVVKSGGDLASILPFKNNASAEIGDKKINLILAKSDKDKVKGLSERKNIEENQGMLFVFNKKDKYSFWMKGVEFPIDIIFIDDNTVVDIFENVPPSKETLNLTTYEPSEPANYVLEVNAGTSKKLNIKKGTKITFNNI